MARSTDRQTCIIHTFRYKRYGHRQVQGVYTKNARTIGINTANYSISHTDTYTNTDIGRPLTAADIFLVQVGPGGTYSSVQGPTMFFREIQPLSEQEIDPECVVNILSSHWNHGPPMPCLDFARRVGIFCLCEQYR